MRRLVASSRPLKRSVGIGAFTLCVVLAGCRDDKCTGPNRDAANCSGGGHGGGGAAGAGRSGSSEGGVARGGFGATGSSSGGSGGE